MTDQTTDTRTLLANWQMQFDRVAAFVETTQAAMTDVEGALGHLYDQAEAAGDDSAKNAVMTTWGRTQQLAAHIQQMDAVLKGTGATLRAIADQRNAIAQELDSLVNAIEECDSDDPRLADFAQFIEECVNEQSSLYMEDMVFEGIYDSMWSNMKNLGLSYADASRAIDLLRGEVDLNPEQVELLKALLDSTIQTEEMK